MRYSKLFTEAIDTDELSGLGADFEDEDRRPLDSVDDQIDSYILKYETESMKEKETEDEIVMESLMRRSMRFLLEAEGDEQDSTVDVKPDAAPANTSADVKKNPQSVDEKPPIDIDAFSKKIARLVMNYKNLLRVETVIVNRASAFLKKNYGKDYVEQMVDILDTQFDFDLEGKNDIHDAPIAAGAGVKPSAG